MALLNGGQAISGFVRLVGEALGGVGWEKC